MAFLRRTAARARSDAGFGMMELLISMVVISVGVLAVFAMFNSGMVQIRRASAVSTAAALADSQIEGYRALKFDFIGLVDSQVAATDSTYKADSAYLADTPSTTLSASITSTQTTMTVASSTGFPTPPFRAKVDSEIVLVDSVSGTTWTLDDAAADGNRDAQDGTSTATHNAGATVTLKRLAGLPACASPAVAPCTDTTQNAPTRTVTGADHKSYRVDTYMTWLGQASSGGSQSRQGKLVTIVVRDTSSPYRTYARVSSAFDLSTGS